MLEAIKTLKARRWRHVRHHPGLDSEKPTPSSGQDFIDCADPDAHHISCRRGRKARCGIARARRPACAEATHERKSCSCVPTTRSGDVGGVRAPMRTIPESVRALPRRSKQPIQSQGDACEGKLTETCAAGRDGVACAAESLLLSDSRKPFWSMAKHALRQGQIDGMMGAHSGLHRTNSPRSAARRPE